MGELESPRIALALTVLVGCWQGGGSTPRINPTDPFAVHCDAGTRSRSEPRAKHQVLSWCVDNSGRRHGPSQLRAADGRIVVRDRYERDKLIDRLVYDAREPHLAAWSAVTEKDGAVRVKGTRRSGKLEGTVVYLDDRGATLFTEEYRDGSLVPVPEPILVRRAYAGLLRVLADKAYERLPALVDRATIDTYETLRRDALFASRADIERRPIAERVLIISMRSQLGEELRQMTGRDVLAEGIEPPMALFAILQEIELDKIRIAGSSAVVTTKFRGKPSTFSGFQFHKEGEQWKLDLLRLTRDLEPYMGSWFRLSTAAGIERYVGARSGTRLGPRIWEPLVRQTR
jgi:hypothetical protein